MTSGKEIHAQVMEALTDGENYAAWLPLPDNPQEKMRQTRSALAPCIVLTEEEAKHARGCINALRYVPKARSLPAADEVIALLTPEALVDEEDE